MRIAKEDIPVRVAVPGATARQKTDFGEAPGLGKIAGEYFSFKSGTDIAPLLQGLKDDLCQSPHWGYVIEGELTVTYKSGEEETVSGGDLFYWPSGHTVKAGKDTDFILFSPQDEHVPVVDHVKSKVSG